MGLFLDAATAWNKLSGTQYIFDLGRKGKLHKLTISFLNEDFPHLAGMQYAKDVDFGLDRAEYSHATDSESFYDSLRGDDRNPVFVL